jgi:hypothetical protein
VHCRSKDAGMTSMVLPLSAKHVLSIIISNRPLKMPPRSAHRQHWFSIQWQAVGHNVPRMFDTEDHECRVTRARFSITCQRPSTT